MYICPHYPHNVSYLSSFFSIIHFLVLLTLENAANKYSQCSRVCVSDSFDFAPNHTRKVVVRILRYNFCFVFQCTFYSVISTYINYVCWCTGEYNFSNRSTTFASRNIHDIMFAYLHCQIISFDFCIYTHTKSEINPLWSGCDTYFYYIFRGRIIITFIIAVNNVSNNGRTFCILVGRRKNRTSKRTLFLRGRVRASCIPSKLAQPDETRERAQPRYMHNNKPNWPLVVLLNAIVVSAHTSTTTL